MVIQTPYSMRAGWFEGVSLDQTADEVQIGVDYAEDNLSFYVSVMRGFKPAKLPYTP